MPLEFGVCTNFLETPDTDPVGMCRIPVIAEAGFQYVELPLCHVAALSDREFERLADVIHSSGLRSPAACNLFPDQMILLGGQKPGGNFRLSGTRLMPCFPAGDTESCVCQRFRMDCL